MPWRKTYSFRITTATAAVKTICSGQRGFLSGNVSMLQTLVQALVQRVWHRAGTLGVIFLLIALLCLFFSQRLAKDYGGTVVIASSYAVAILGLILLGVKSTP